MKRQRRQYSADWKAKIALEVVKGQRTIQKIASHYEIHPHLVAHWKKQWLEGAAQIFWNGQAAGADEALEAELDQQIGKLQVEVDWLKKSPDFRVRGTAAMDRSGSRRTEHRPAMRAGRGVALGAVLPAGGRERGEPGADAFAGRAVHAHAVLWGAPHEVVAGAARLAGEREAGAAAEAADGAGSDLSESAAVGAGARTSDLSLPAARVKDRPTRPGVEQRHHLYPPAARVIYLVAILDWFSRSVLE
jgi:transposase